MRCFGVSTKILFSAGFSEPNGPVWLRNAEGLRTFYRDFYALFLITRGRHHLPPTPYAWFRNLIHCQDKAWRSVWPIKTKPSRRHSHFAIQGRRLLQVWMFRCAVQ